MKEKMSALVRTATGMPELGSLTGKVRRCMWRKRSSTFGSLSVVLTSYGYSII